MKRSDSSSPRGVVVVSMATLETLTPTVMAAPGVVEAGAGQRMHERRRRVDHDRASIGDQADPQRAVLQCRSRVFDAAERQQARWQWANALSASDTHRSAMPTVH